MEATFWRLGSRCTDNIRSVHDMHRVTKGYLFKFTINTAHISSNKSHFLLAGFLDYWPYKVSKFGTVCLHMLCSLQNVLAHHLWVQFLKSTLFNTKIWFFELARPSQIFGRVFGFVFDTQFRNSLVGDGIYKETIKCWGTIKVKSKGSALIYWNSLNI